MWNVVVKHKYFAIITKVICSILFIIAFTRCSPNVSDGAGGGIGGGGDSVSANSSLVSYKNLKWTEGTSSNSSSLHAIWTQPTGVSITNQKIQYYSDNNCATTSGSLVPLSNTAANNIFVPSADGYYTFKISYTIAGISSTSSCSDSILSDRTAPNIATTATWSQTSPYNATAVNAIWTKSTSTDLANQKIQFYSNNTCTTTSGSLINLNSTTTQTYAFTGTNGSSYAFIITSIDNVGNTSTSACSSNMTIDTTPPNAATSLSWSQSTPYNSTSVTASWTKSNSSDLSNQKIQFYSDGTCTTTSGSLINLSSSSTQTYAFSGTNGSTYSYKVTSFDAAGNSTASACSSSMVIDTTAPNAATSLGWTQTSPYNSTSVTASWTKSTSSDLSNQKIQFYSDGTCTTTSGSLIDLSSASTQTYAFSGTNGNTYTYKITSFDAAGNSTTSACSSSMVIDTSAPNAATSLSWVESSPTSNTTINASWTKSNSGDLSNQKIQLYSDGSCTTTSGSLINLSSSSTQTYAFSASAGNTYSYKVTSFDSAGNSTASACSSSLVVQSTIAAATSVSWSQTSPYNNTSVTASWTKSVDGTLTNQKLQFYSDGTCTTTSGGLIDLSSNSTQTYAFSGVNGTTYTYKVTSIDNLSNSSVSACSSTMTIDTTAPNASTSLGWTQTSPYNSTSVTASWTKSNSGDLSNQKIQLYSDGTCTTTSGSLIDLSSSSTQTYAFSGTNGNTYSYKVTSFDAATNSTVSACSSSMVIDTSAPNAASSLGWSQSSPRNSTAITASWTKSNSGDLSNQKIQLYSDGTCTTTSGSLIDLSSNSTQTYAFTAPADGTYAYIVTSFDSALNSTASACSSSMVVDTAAPNAATSLGWSQTSPYNSTSITASWTKSNSGDLSNQKIQFYADGSCSSTSGGLIDLSSNSAQTYAWTAPSDGTFTYKLTSFDTAGNSTESACSGSMVVDTAAPTVTGLSNDATIAKTKTWTWGCSEGSATYQYEIDTTSNTTPTAAYGSTTTASQNSGDNTYYIHVRCKDAAGNASAIVHASVTLDNTAPTAPSNVNDGTALNSLTSSTNASWTASTDANGIDHYEYAIGTTAGATDVRSWTTTGGTSTNFTAATLSLTSDTTYYFSVRALDAAGNISSVGQGNGWIADTTLPGAPTAVTLGSVPSGTSTTPTISWTAPSDTSGISYYDVQIHLASDNSVVQSWTTKSSGDQFTGLSLTASTAYYVKVRAIDNAGNTGTSYGQSSNWTTTGCSAAAQTFTYTGADQTITVPAGCGHMRVKIWGAGGGGGSAKGGGGGFVDITLTVTPGESLNAIVGSGGGGSTASGGNGAGGGRSAIQRSGADIATAGGGGGGTNSYRGGAGGANTGETASGPGGTGGTQSAGGVMKAGSAGGAETTGSLYTGGSRASTGVTGPIQTSPSTYGGGGSSGTYNTLTCM